MKTRKNHLSFPIIPSGMISAPPCFLPVAFIFFCCILKAEVRTVEPGATITPAASASWQSGDEILLLGNAELGGTIDLTNKPVTIQSDTPDVFRTIDAKNFLAIKTNVNATLTFDRIEIIRSFFSGNGGAISITGGAGSSTTTINGDFRITHSSATGNGGAVSSERGTMIFGGNVEFDNNTAGTTGGALYSGNAVFFEKNAIISSNTSASNGAAIYAGGTLVFRGDATLSYNTAQTTSATVYGGAIYAGSTVLFSGTARLENNRSSSAGRGGAAIYMNAGSLQFSKEAFLNDNTSAGAGGGVYFYPTTGNVQFDGHVTATNNYGVTGGGAIYSRSDVYINSGAYMAHNRTDVAYSGGAIHLNVAGKVLDITGYSVFLSNTSGANGGAIYANGKVFFRDGATMSDNVVTNATNGRGGAVRATEGVFIYGSGTFTGNMAASAGGALSIGAPAAAIASMTIALNATSGDIVFRGNLHNTTATAGANAIYYSLVNAGDGVLALDAGAGRTIAFYDPVSGTNDTKSADKMRVIKSGSGTVLFDSHHSDIVATTTVGAGTFRITGGAIYGADIGAGSFAVAPDATLSGNGAVRAATISIGNGATLEAVEGGTLRLETAGAPVIGTGLALAGSGTISAGAPLNAGSIRAGTSGATVAETLSLTDSLTLADGALLRHTLYSGNAAHNIAALGGITLGTSATISLDTLETGTFVLLTWDGGAGLTVSDTDRFSLIANGVALTARARASLEVDTVARSLVLTNQIVSLDLAWTGAENAIWSNAPGVAANWTDGAANAEKYFRDGDSILFDDDGAAANRTVTLAGRAIASQMRVAGGGTHAFTGTGGITTESASVLAGSAIVTGTGGKLLKTGAGVLAFENTGTNRFVSGIDHSGGVISFASASQITTGPDAAIALGNNAVLRAAADVTGLDGTLSVAASSDAGVFDTGVFSVGYSGTLQGAGTLVKIGSGTFTANGAASSAFAGAVRVDAGSLLVAAASVLGGNIHVGPGALAGGAGTFGGNVTLADGAALRVGGLTTASTLTIGGTLTLDNATLLFGHFSGGPSDVLTIAAGGALVATGSNTIDITAPAPGVYTLGNIAQLDTPNATVTIDGQRQIAGGRQTAALSSATGNLLLLTFNADQSRILTWTGSAGGQWNIADSNWDNAITQKFVGGDTVKFSGAPSGSNTVTIAGSGVTVSDMIVDSASSYTFTGAGITARADSVVRDAGVSEVTDPQGMLTKSGAGTLTFANAANTFKGGIEIAGGVLAFSSAGQLGTLDDANVDHAITFSGNGTLRALADGITLANKIVITGAALATIDVVQQAHTLTLGGIVTGATAGGGTLAKTGAGTLKYSGTAALGHAVTRIDEGVVTLRDIAAADIGTLAHTFQLSGENSWLDLSDTPGFDSDNPDDTTANDWAALNIIGAAGHVIGGNDKITLRAGETAFGIGDPALAAKQGVYVVVDAAGGVATMSGPNSHAGYTIICGGVLRVTDDNQLGLASLNREVVLDGAGATLELSGNGFSSARPIEMRQDGSISVAASSTAAWHGVISGSSRTLSKTGDGTLVLTGANDAGLVFSIDAGVLQGNSSSLRGNIVNAATLVFDQAFDGGYDGVISGGGVFEKRGDGMLTLTQSSVHGGTTRVRAGTLRAGAANVLSPLSAHTVSAGARLDLGGFDQTVSSLDANGVIVFDATFNTGNGLMGHANKLTVASALTGSGTLLVRVTENPALTAGVTSINVLESGAGSDASRLSTVPDHRLVSGIYEIVPNLDAAGNLTLNSAMISPEVPAATAIPMVSLLMGQAGLDSAAQRLGELRTGGARANSFWARGIYREDNITGKLFKGSETRTTGVQTGFDFTFPNMWADNSAFVLGFMLDTFDSSGSPGSAGDLDGHQYALGIYGTLALGRWRMDAVLRFDRGEFDVDAPDDQLEIKGAGISASLEAGYAVMSGAHGRIEPVAQLIYQRRNFSENIDRFERDYRFGAADSLQARAGMRWSRNVPAGVNKALVPWLRVGGGYEFNGRQNLRTGLFDLENNPGGALFLADCGVTLLLGPRASLYAGGIWSQGGNIETLSASAGARFSW